MKLASKLRGAILSVALIPLLGLGLVYYASYRREVTGNVSEHLKSVAAVQQSRLTAIMLQNEERLALISSRTQLRLSLDHYLREGDPAARATMLRILDDAAKSITDLETITVYSTDGAAVAGTDGGPGGPSRLDPELLRVGLQRRVVDHMLLAKNGAPRICLCGPLALDGKTLGVVVVESKVDNLLSSLFDYSGLGQTGETLLVRSTANGGHIFLAPTRFDAQAALREFWWNGSVGGGNGALTAASGVPVLDYRHVKVLAEARKVPDTDWVLVVKIDEGEALAGLHGTTRIALLMVGAALALIALVSAALARRLSAPLVELSGAARAIAQGDYGRKVQVQSNDELGVLESSFNIMSSGVARAQAELQKRLDELDREIIERKLVETERERLIAELRLAVSEVKRLQGIIPICAHCKKIRNDKGSWQQLEAYIHEHSEAMFSHGICPDCFAKVEADLDRDFPSGDSESGAR